MTENTGDKAKENNNNKVNFTWKEIDESPKKKGIRWPFHFRRNKASDAKKDKTSLFGKGKDTSSVKTKAVSSNKDKAVSSTATKAASPEKEKVAGSKAVEAEKTASAVASKADIPKKEKAAGSEVVEAEKAVIVAESKAASAEKVKVADSEKSKAESPKKKKKSGSKKKKTAVAEKSKAADAEKEKVVDAEKEAAAPEKDEAAGSEVVEAEKAVSAAETKAASAAETMAVSAENVKVADSEKGKAESPKKKKKSGSKKKKAAISGKEKPARTKKLITKGRVALAVLCLFVAAFVGAFIYAYNSVPAVDPDPSSIYSNIALSSIIYDASGKEIDKLYYTEDREIVPIKDIPEVTKNAFIAIEDKTFYRHHGLNYKRLIGAVFNKLTGRSSEISGTSTITQQLARNVFLADIKSERSISRKVREMIYALKIERAYSKDEILEAYLNTIYLGYGCYGIKAAAYTYFGKDVSDLDLKESAALAALPQAPDNYALLKDTKDENTTYLKKSKLYANGLATERRDLVLDLMAEQGYINTSEAEEAKKKISKILHPHIEKKPMELTYFTDFLTTEVANDLAEKYNMTVEEAELRIHTGGLHIYSTIDQDIQNAINTEFSDDWNFPYSEEDPQAAMVVTEVGTGRIRAMVGGRNTSGQMLFNRATSPRQPGSSIKPLAVYSAALQKSEDFARRAMPYPFVDYGFDRQGTKRWGDYITAGSTVIDERMKVNGEIWPLNFSRRFSGYRTFRTALQQSINTCAVKIQLQVGADYSMEMLRKYGISTVADDASVPVNDYNPAALALGAMTYGTTPLDMALAYATFPNRGIRNTGTAYTKVTDSKGNVVLERQTEEIKVLDENVAFIMRDCLESVVSRGIARNASIYGVQVGGKTGTTNDNYDYWFVGFTPRYSAALWIGTDHNTVMSGSSGTAALLWSRIMSQVPDITWGEYPPQPEDVVMVRGEYYTEKTQP